MQYNVESVACSEALRGSFEPVKPEAVPAGKVTGGQGAVAYLVPWGTAASGRLLAAALREGLRIFSADKPLAQSGRSFPSGTLIFKAKENPADLRATLERLAAKTGAEVVATDTGWVEDGVNFGSGNVVYMRRPVIALAWDLPVSAGSAGWTRYVLERQFGYPVSVIRTRQLANADLSKFHVIIFPDGNESGYASTLGADGIRRLRDWLSEGGTLVALGSGAVSFLADSRTGLLAISRENVARAGRPQRDAEPAREAEPAARPQQSNEARGASRLLASEEDYNRAIQADSEMPDAVAGVLVKARLDGEHWVAAGLDKPVHVLVEGRSIYTPVKLDRGVNAAIYLGADQLLASGYLWEENRKQLAFKPFVVVQPQGRGAVIGFTSDPNFRAYMDGLNVLFLNAVFRGAAHARPAP
jgi:hypothetical protein